MHLIFTTKLSKSFATRHDDTEIESRPSEIYAEIGRASREQPKRDLEGAAVKQETYENRELLSHRSTARGEDVQERLGQVEGPGLRDVWYVLMLGLSLYIGWR